eukprot:3134190-Karenia_brevis.AAC.1
MGYKNAVVNIHHIPHPGFKIGGRRKINRKNLGRKYPAARQNIHVGRLSPMKVKAEAHGQYGQEWNHRSVRRHPLPLYGINPGIGGAQRP